MFLSGKPMTYTVANLHVGLKWFLKHYLALLYVDGV